MDQAATTSEQSAGEARTYRLTPTAQRIVVALLLGVLAIAVYALWTLVSLIVSGLDGPDWVTAALMLAILAFSPAVVWSLLAEYNATITTDAAGLTFQTVGVRLPYPWAQVGAPLPASPGWGRISFGREARSAGRNAEATVEKSLVVPGTGTDGEIRPSLEGPAQTGPPGEPDADNGDLLHVTVDPPPATRLANPLVRLLYRQAYGAGVPLYAGLADRAALLAEIAARGGHPA